MNKICKRLLSMAIVLVMVLSMVPVNHIHVHAEELTTLTYLFQSFDGASYNKLSGITTEVFDTWYTDGKMKTAGSDYWRYLANVGRSDLQTSRFQLYSWTTSRWLAIELMNVPNGVYEATITQAGKQGIEVYVLSSTDYASETYNSDLTKFAEAPTGKLGTTTATASTSSKGTSTFDLTCDDYTESGNYVLILHGTATTGTTVNLYSLVLEEQLVHTCAGAAAATCTEAEVCSTCGEELTPALGHIWVSPTTSSAAYCSRSDCGVTADGVVSVVTEAGGQYVYDTNYKDKSYEEDDRGWIADMGHSIGKFVHYAESNEMLEGGSGTAAYTPTKSTKNAGSWVAFMFNVGQQGTYGITMDIATSKAIQAYIVAGDYLEFGRAVDANNTKVNALQSPIEIAASEEFNASGRPISYTAHCGDMVLAPGEYLLILKTTEASTLITFASMELHCSNVQGANGTYTSVANAIAKGETNLTLIGNITEDVAVINNATLNLGGYSITGDVDVTYGTVKGEGNVSGTLSVPESHQMPLSDGNGNYKFFTPTNVTPASKTNATTGHDEYWFDVLLDNDAYTRIATGKSGMKVNVDITWKPADWAEGDELASKAFEFAGDAVTDWANGELNERNYGLCVQFTTIPADVSEVTVTVTYTANGAAVVYESPVAANG